MHEFPVCQDLISQIGDIARPPDAPGAASSHRHSRVSPREPVSARQQRTHGLKSNRPSYASAAADAVRRPSRPPTAFSARLAAIGTTDLIGGDELLLLQVEIDTCRALACMVAQRGRKHSARSRT